MGDLFGCAQARTDENIHVFEFSITRWLLSGPVLFVFIRELDGTGIAVACGGSSARNNRGEVDGASRGMPTSELDTERGSLYYSAPWWHVLPKRRVGYCAVVLAAMVTRDWVRQRGQYIVAAGVNMESCMVLRMHERARFTVYRRGVDGDEIHLGDNVDLAKRLHCLIDGTPTPIAFVSALGGAFVSAREAAREAKAAAAHAAWMAKPAQTGRTVVPAASVSAANATVKQHGDWFGEGNKRWCSNCQDWFPAQSMRRHPFNSQEGGSRGPRGGATVQHRNAVQQS